MADRVGEAAKYIDSSGVIRDVTATQPMPVTTGDNSAGAALTKLAKTLTGASAAMLAADATRKIVIVSNAASNDAAAIDITGGTASLTAGLPLAAGGVLTITGVAAQAAMTMIGTNAQVLTVYTG